MLPASHQLYCSQPLVSQPCQHLCFRILAGVWEGQWGCLTSVCMPLGPQWIRCCPAKAVALPTGLIASGLSGDIPDTPRDDAVRAVWASLSPVWRAPSGQHMVMLVTAVTHQLWACPSRSDLLVLQHPGP